MHDEKPVSLKMGIQQILVQSRKPNEKKVVPVLVHTFIVNIDADVNIVNRAQLAVLQGFPVDAQTNA
jgi:hypothetical protein